MQEGNDPEYNAWVNRLNDLLGKFPMVEAQVVRLTQEIQQALGPQNILLGELRQKSELLQKAQQEAQQLFESHLARVNAQLAPEVRKQR